MMLLTTCRILAILGTKIQPCLGTDCEDRWVDDIVPERDILMHIIDLIRYDESDRILLGIHFVFAERNQRFISSSC